jgi:hypothetical protein
MAVDRRRKNEYWEPGREDGSITWDRVDTALLMDIRDELHQLNALLGCSNFLGIPRRLQEIATNTKRRPRKPKEPKA